MGCGGAKTVNAGPSRLIMQPTVTLCSCIASNSPHWVLGLSPIRRDHVGLRKSGLSGRRFAFERYSAAFALTEQAFDLSRSAGAMFGQRAVSFVWFARLLAGPIALALVLCPVGGFLFVFACAARMSLALIALPLFHHLFEKLLRIQDCPSIQLACDPLIQLIKK